MQRKPVLTLALAAAVLALPVRAAELNPTEHRIVAEVRAWSGEALGLLERSARINSGTMNVAGVRAVGEVFAKEFEQIGMRTAWLDMPADMRRAGHLVALSEGKQGKRLLLLGHLDTVFEPDAPARCGNARENMRAARVSAT